MRDKLMALNQSDKFKITIASPQMKNREFSSGIKLVSDFDIHKIMNNMSAVLQSNENVDINTISYTLVTIKMPRGGAGAGARLAVYHHEDIYKKKCVIQIKN